MAFLTMLLLTFMGGFLLGLICATPFLVCGIICFLFKRNAGLWCAWAVYFMVDIFLRMTTGSQRNSIYQIYYYIAGEYALTVNVIIGWILCFTMAVLTWITIVRFKNNPLELNCKTKRLLCAGLAIAILIKIMQLILPYTAYYSYFLAHIIDLSLVHTLVYGLLDWLKIGIVIALIVNFARYRWKPTMLVTIGIVLLTVIINFIVNISIVDSFRDNLSQHTSNSQNKINTSGDKSLYSHGLDIIAMLNEIVNSKEYVQAFSGSQDIINEINDISEGN